METRLKYSNEVFVFRYLPSLAFTLTSSNPTFFYSIATTYSRIKPEIEDFLFEVVDLLIRFLD